MRFATETGVGHRFRHEGLVVVSARSTVEVRHSWVQQSNTDQQLSWRSRPPRVPVLRWVHDGREAGAGDLRLCGSTSRRGVLGSHARVRRPSGPAGVRLLGCVRRLAPRRAAGVGLGLSGPGRRRPTPVLPAGARRQDGEKPAAPRRAGRGGADGRRAVAALEAEAARLVPLGARRLHLLPADEENEACLVMQDVEGNEFCLD